MSDYTLDQKAYWVGFNHVKGIGPVRMQSILAYFGDPKTAWDAPESELVNSGLPPKVTQNLLDVRKNLSLEKVWKHIEEMNIQVSTIEDPDYPTRLREVDNHPPVIYTRGTILADDSWSVAIVGTRRMTSYGKQVASEIASALTMNGITVVSGLARGIDGIAHKSALEAGGRTIAVLGSGVDQIYPPEHRKLANAIIQNGAILSDYAPGTPPDGINFPPRNRIISGLSLAVVIVEASKQSGALITAAFAAEQGREVFAVPGNIYAPQSKGSNILLQQGARVLLNVQDILESLNLAMVNQHREARQVLPSNATEAALFDVLSDEPLHVDEICAQSALPIDTVSSTLTMMELKGMVRQLGGMKYIAIREPESEYRIGE